MKPKEKENSKIAESPKAKVDIATKISMGTKF
jgi:hypothetical protein